jgi:hypothetical protein
MRQLRRLAPVVAVAAVVGLMATSAAMSGPVTVTPLMVVSGPSPFAGCTIGQFNNATLYVNAEEEPWVAVNPTNVNNIIGVWQQDRWSNGGAHGLLTAVSHDGGQTWATTFPHFSECAGGTPANGGDFTRSSDPWVTFSPNGVVYQISLSVSLDRGAENAVLVSRSTDGGDTWSEPITLIRDSSQRDSSYAFNDKESITADPTDARYAYAVWDRFVTPSGTSKASLEGFFNSRSFRQPIWFSRTTDGGQTWEPARKIYDRSEFTGTIGNQIAVLPDGTVVNVFDEFFLTKNSDKQRGESIAVIRSTDKGVTWPKRSTVVAPSREIGAFDPDTGRPIRAEGGIPEIAVDRATGAIYVVWQDASFSGVDEIALSKSTDGGQTWSMPIRINQTPRNPTAANQQAFVPNISVADDGTVAVTYYDFRNNDANAGVPTDYWVVHCHSAVRSCTNPADWGDEARLTDASFDIEQAPAARGPFGFFLGEYEGLASRGNGFVSLFIGVNNGNAANRTDAVERMALP